MPSSIRPNVFSLPQPRPHMEEKFAGDPRGSGVPCPVISTLVNEGRLVPNADGEVSIETLQTALMSLNIDSPTALFLAEGGARDTGTLEREVVNLLKLQGSPSDHRGSLGPLQDGGFNEHFLDQLKSFSEDGVSLTFEDLAAASKLRILQDGADGVPVTQREQGIGAFEIAALFMVFGTVNDAGVKVVSLDAVESLFRDNKLPEGYVPGAMVSTALVKDLSMQLAMKQNMGSAAARAERGFRDALEETPPVDTTSMLGLSAICPAGMRPQEGAGTTPADIGALHNDIEMECE